MHLTLVLAFLLRISAIAQAQGDCGNYCAYASTCLERGCFYSWEAMHCYASEKEAYDSRLKSASLSGYNRCINVGGPHFVDSDGFEFKADKIISGKFEKPGATIDGASPHDQQLYRTGRGGKHVRYNVHFLIKRNEDLQIRLFFADLRYQRPRQRLMKITFNGVTLEPRLDVVGEAGYATAYTFHFPVKRIGNDLLVGDNLKATRYPSNDHPLLGVYNMNSSKEPWAILNGLCIHHLLDCTSFCGNPASCRAKSHCVYDENTGHCVGKELVDKDEDCERRTVGFGDTADKCVACVQGRYCAFDSSSLKCHSVASVGEADYKNVEECTSDPSHHDGEGVHCRKRGFAYCCETQKCYATPEEAGENCGTGCQGLCFDAEKCEQANCLYTSTNECVDCGLYDEDPATCRTKGCSFCCDTNQCHPHNDASCSGGCSLNCFSPEECTNAKCGYNQKTSQCQDCSKFNDAAFECRENGCEYCCETSTCHSKLPDSCKSMSNCTQLCFYEDECKAQQCSYNKETGFCTDCTKYDGDVVECRENGCDFCCADHTCKASLHGNCDQSKCSAHCFRPGECEAAECNYNNVTHSCFECNDFSTDHESCRSNGCKYCCESGLCKRDCVGNCEEGCIAYCFDQKKCEAEECVYLPVTNRCLACEEIESAAECISTNCAYCCESSTCQSPDDSPNCVRSKSGDHDYAAGKVLTLYDDTGYTQSRGEPTEITDFDICPGCRNLPAHSINTASSIRTDGLCFYVFNAKDCDFKKGERELICTEQSDLSAIGSNQVNLNDKINSILLFDENTVRTITEDCEKVVANAGNDFDACTECASSPLCYFDPKTRQCGYVGDKVAGDSYINSDQCSADPTLSNGNADNCRERGYVYCCDTDMCVTPEDAVNCGGNQGCSKHCFDAGSCEGEGCLFTKDNQCVDCSKNTNDAGGCRAQGCSYCCDTSACHPHVDASCSGGCSQNCFSPNECSESKCAFNKETNVCHDCSMLNGMPHECRESGCEYCCTTGACNGTSSAECGTKTKCTAHCHNQVECESNDCLYSEASGACSDCSPYNNDAIACRENGCDYCCQTKTCHPIVPDSCAGGCSQDCFQPNECAAKDCFYNTRTNECTDCTLLNGNSADCKRSGCTYCCDTSSCHAAPSASCQTYCDTCRQFDHSPRECVNSQETEPCYYCCQPETCQNHKRWQYDCERVGYRNAWAKDAKFSIRLSENTNESYTMTGFEVCPHCQNVQMGADAAKTISAPGYCYTVYEEKNCRGRKAFICGDQEDMSKVLDRDGKLFGLQTRSVEIERIWWTSGT